MSLKQPDRLGTCRLLLLASVIASPSTSWGGATSAPEATASGDVSTVVLVSIDTLRRDAVGFFGDRQPSPTPFLDQLAAQGIAFVDAMAPVPLTGPSHWSMLTGRWPWHEGVRLNSFSPTTEGTRTLAQHLGDAGWTTGAFVSCYVLDPRFGFARGFETYDADMSSGDPSESNASTERVGRETVRAALAWVRERAPNERIFLWVHLFEPHEPWPPAREEFSGPHGDYLTDVHEADRQVAALHEGLSDAGRPLERSLWVVISDHGEGLGDHGEETHGLLLHGATTRIPLVFVGRGLAARRDDYLTSTPDLLPTLLGLLGLPAPAGDGVDLLATERPQARSIPLESVFAAMAYGLAPVQGLRTGEWLWESSPADHLWNVVDDPGEQTDLAHDQVDELGRLKEVRATFGFPAVETGAALEPETIEKLGALGYVGSGSDRGSDPGTGDVRAFVTEGFNWMVEIKTLMSVGRHEDAEVVVQRFLERYPRSTTMWFNAALISLGRNRLDEGEDRLRKVLELQPSYDDARVNLGNLLAMRGRFGEAEAEYRQVLERDPTNLHALFNLAASMARQQKYEEATTYWRQVIELYPDHPRAAVARERLAAQESAGRRD